MSVRRRSVFALVFPSTALVFAGALASCGTDPMPDVDAKDGATPVVDSAIPADSSGKDGSGDARGDTSPTDAVSYTHLTLPTSDLV